MKGKKTVFMLALVFVMLASSYTSYAAPSPSAIKFPTKPIQVIVPMAAGGTSDLAARAMEKVSKQYLGQPLVIENKAGASGILGYNKLIDSKNDGYTLGLSAANMLLQPLYGITPNN